LLSDYELWHYVLNYWYIPTAESDDTEFQRRFPDCYSKSWKDVSPEVLNDEFHQLTERSWQRVFDLDWEEEYVSHPRNEKCMQATLWEIRRSMVRDVCYFKGSLKPTD